jgi:hypothetical protein
MAQRVNVVIESDLSGKPDAATVRFGLDGTGYEIDLTDKEAADFRRKLDAYVSAARKFGRGTRARTPTVTRVGPHTKTVRKWAESQGIKVNPRGRIPQEITDRFLAANK